MEYIFVDDDGFFYHARSREELMGGVEFPDEVIFICDEQGRSYILTHGYGSSPELTPSRGQYSFDLLSGLWLDYNERWPCENTLHRKWAEGRGIVGDIFQVMSLMKGAAGNRHSDKWVVEAAGRSWRANNIRSVTRVCRRLAAMGVREATVIDPYGRRYIPRTTRARKAFWRSCLVFEEISQE